MLWLKAWVLVCSLWKREVEARGGAPPRLLRLTDISRIARRWARTAEAGRGGGGAPPPLASTNRHRVAIGDFGSFRVLRGGRAPRGCFRYSEGVRTKRVL